MLLLLPSFLFFDNFLSEASPCRCNQFLAAQYNYILAVSHSSHLGVIWGSFGNHFWVICKSFMSLHWFGSHFRAIWESFDTHIKFSFSEKATKVGVITYLIWRLLSKCQIKWVITPNFCGLIRKAELYYLVAYKKRIFLHRLSSFEQKCTFLHFVLLYLKILSTWDGS